MTMSEVATAARVSKTTLYSRFPDKEALLRAILAVQVESWGSGLYNIPHPAYETLEATLIGYGDTALRAAMTDEFLQWQRLMQSESRRFPELADMAQARFRLGIDYISERIEAFSIADNIPCRDAAAAAEIFMLVLTGWSQRALIRNQAIAPEERTNWLRSTTAIFLGGRNAW